MCIRDRRKTAARETTINIILGVILSQGGTFLVIFITCKTLMYFLLFRTRDLVSKLHHEITTNGKLFYTSFHVGVR